MNQRRFVGTESRPLTLFDLLKQLSEGSETDPAARLAGLQRRRDEIDAEMARVLDGDIPLLDDTAIKDRFQQVTQLARGLLSDFREVEQNFRGLDRKVRERIALWNGAKGDLLGEIIGARDAIADSDQGRSFRAFWDFLMSADRQEEFTALLERILALAPVMEIPEIAASIELPMERRLHAPAAKPTISDMALMTGNTEIDASALYVRFVVDKVRLAGNIRQALQSRTHVNLAELCRRQKLRHGLAELVAYLQLAADDFQALVDDSVTDTVVWERTGPTELLETVQARIPRVIYLA